MGMFKLMKNSIDYSNYLSEFKRQHNLSPFTSISGPGPSKYPCLIGSLKAFAKRPNKVLQTGGDIGTVYIIEEIIENEIYYRSQAKKLVYPSEGRLARPKSVKIANNGDLDRFIETFWENYHRHNDGGMDHRYRLQLEQVNELCSNVDAEALPCIVTLKDVNIDILDNCLISVAIFSVLTKEEARSLVYCKKNAGLNQKKRKSDIMAAAFIKEAIKKTRKTFAVGDEIPF